MSLSPQQLDSLTREEAEQVAASVLRAIARESFRRHRNKVTATREASQLVHLATKLDAFASPRLEQALPNSGSGVVGVGEAGS